MEFRVRDKREHLVASKNGPLSVYVLKGTQLMDTDMVEATTCFRFINSPNGPIHVQTLGLDRTFPEEDQIALLTSFEVR